MNRARRINSIVGPSANLFMKTCPTCHRTYSDDTLSFCLDDGSRLTTSKNSEPTHIIPADRLVPAATIPNIPPGSHPKLGQTSPGHANLTNPISTNGRKTNPLLYIIIALLALIAGGGLVALLLLGRSSNPSKQVANLSGNNQEDSQQKLKLQNQQAELDRERQRLEDEPTKLESQKTKPVDTTAPSVDSPTRINFRRGSVRETVSGVVSRSKSYVLKCKAGQYLSATVTSNGCVVFNTASNSINFETASGDNWITVINNCGTQSAFNLTVDVR